MQKYLLTFVFLCIGWTAQAQKIILEKFENTPFDLSASTNLRNDLNGNPCALIKVQFPYEGVVFEGNVIGEVEYKTGEYWVYMSSGSRRLTVKHPKLSPLKVEFSEYTIKSLEKKNTYLMVLTSDVQDIPAEQTLTIRYQPTNAIVLVDSKIVQGENGVATLTLPCGEHSYTVAAEGYHSAAGTYNLKSEAPGVIRAYLEPINQAKTTLEVKLLADSEDQTSETSEFKDGDNLYLYLNAPQDGYVAAYFVDPVAKIAVRVLPYILSNEENLAVSPEKPYVFFPESTSDGFVLTTEQNIEHDSLFLIFSPNAFYRSNSERKDYDSGMWQLPKTEFEKWLKRIKDRDADMIVMEKEVIIKK